MTPDTFFELFLLAPVGLVEVNEDGHVEVANPAAKRLLMPFTRDGVLDNLFEALSPVAPDLAARARSFDGPRGPVVDGLDLLTPEMKRGITLSLVKMSAGHFMVVVADATTLAESQGMVSLLEQRLRAVEGAMRDYAVITVGTDGKIDSWNESAERLFQWNSAHCIGKPLSMCLPPDVGGEPHVQHTLSLAARDGWCEEEGHRIRRDGSSFWAATVVTALRTENGVPYGYSVVTRDLTERKKFEDASREGSAATTDYLTGVSTRRGFFDVASIEIARARRYGQPLTLLLVDPDRFRELNESHGTDFADEALRAIAWVCRQESRTTDVVGRVGGKEFAVLLPSTEMSGGLVLAERIRERMQRHVFPGTLQGVRCTLCVGVVELGEGASSVDAMLTQGETAVQRAKQAGRNLVVGYDV